MSVQITALQADSFKRLHAVSLEPTPNGLTVIGGRNGQGKTSVLDAIVYALGGEKYRPTDARNRDDDKPPKIEIKLSNGLVVTRQGAKSALKVVDKGGLKGNQGVLDAFMEKLALDLPKFLQSTDREKAKVLLKIVGADEKLEKFEKDEADLFNKRTMAGKIRDQAYQVLDSMQRVDAPDELVSVSGLVSELNAATEKLLERSELTNIVSEREEMISGHEELIFRLRAEIDQAKSSINTMAADIRVAREKIQLFAAPDVDGIKAKIENSESVNDGVRNNQKYQDQLKKFKEADALHTSLHEDVGKVREDRAALLAAAKMPLDGLSVLDGELIYNRSRWDCMSSADQLKVATSIVQQLNPECGFVLLDKLEQMDVQTMREFGEWASAKGLQIIATRVSTGKECTFIIEDGCVSKSRI